MPHAGRVLVVLNQDEGTSTASVFCRPTIVRIGKPIIKEAIALVAVKPTQGSGLFCLVPELGTCPGQQKCVCFRHSPILIRSMYEVPWYQVYDTCVVCVRHVMNEARPQLFSAAFSGRPGMIPA